MTSLFPQRLVVFHEAVNTNICPFRDLYIYRQLYSGLTYVFENPSSMSRHWLVSVLELLLKGQLIENGMKSFTVALKTFTCIINY